MMDDLYTILFEHNISQNNIVGLIPYGSRTYGLINEFSDYDYVCVVKERVSVNTIQHNKIDINIWQQEDFIDRTESCHIETLENLFCPDQLIILGHEFLNSIKSTFVVDKVKLRKSVSTIGSRCVHYAKILWNKNNYEKSKKNIVHAYRFTVFGLQLLKTGSISNYQCANEFSRSITDVPNNGNFKETMKSPLLGTPGNNCQKISLVYALFRNKLFFNHLKNK